MTKTKLTKAAGRYGPRVGQYVRRKIADIESKQRKKQKCPFCGRRAIRLSKGIWKCLRCEKKFAGHAYYLEEGLIKVPKEIRMQSKVLKNEDSTIKEVKKSSRSKKIKSENKNN